MAKGNQLSELGQRGCKPGLHPKMHRAAPCIDSVQRRHPELVTCCLQSLVGDCFPS